MRQVSALITTASIAVIAFLLGVYFTYRRNRDRTGIVPASRLDVEEALSAVGNFLDEEKRGQSARPPIDPPDHIGPKRIEPIARALFEKLNRVTPSRDGDMLYYPCRVVTRDGRVFDRVYVQPREPYLTRWGVLPFDDRDKGWIAISEIVDLEESPFRLPPHLADKVYRWGETGMGYFRFRVGFRRWRNSAVATGNAVDFIPLPQGVTGADVKRVHRHGDRDWPTELAPRYYWSIYEGVGPN